jgi:hypothetical protein
MKKDDSLGPQCLWGKAGVYFSAQNTEAVGKMVRWGTLELHF